MEYILSPSILSADFARLGEEVELIASAGAQYVHIDVMDGSFVPNITIGAPVVKSLRPHTDHVFDVHLMVEEPVRFIDDFAAAGADLITVHAEACRHLDMTLSAIRKAGCRVGVSLNPATPLCMIGEVLSAVDMVLIMSVNPGFGGQKLIPYTLEKIAALSAMRKERGLHFDIEIDGGVNRENIADILKAGANIIVAGSSIFGGDPKENIKHFLQCFREYCGNE